MLGNNQLVSVCILSYNRKEELRNTIERLLDLDYKNLQIIVIDNNSCDGTNEMLRLEFKKVEVIELRKNIGISGWNEGFKISKGDFIFVLDDDSFPENGTIEKGIAEFYKNKKIGIIAFNIFNTRFQKSETEELSEKSPTTFIGCGTMFRKKMLDEIEYYDDNYFLYHNEMDLAIRCYDANYDILYLKNAVVIHNLSSVARKNSGQNPFISKLRFYHNSIGRLIFIWKYFDCYLSIFVTIKFLMSRFIIAVGYWYPLVFVKILFNFLVKIPKILKKRKVVNKNLQAKYYYGNTRLIDDSYFPKRKNI